jgi:hypothetical protein
MVTGIFVNLFFKIAFYIVLFAPIATGQCFTVRISELIVKSPKEIPNGCYRLFSLLILHAGCSGCTYSAEITQVNSSPKENTANRFTRFDGAAISYGGPLIGCRIPALYFPQNLQDRFRSGIAFSHQLHAFVPKFF